MSISTACTLRWWWLLCLAMIVAACATGRQPPADTNWWLVELDGAPVAASGQREPYIRLLSEGGRLTGYTTCNNLFGRYESHGGGRVRFVSLGSTRAACVDPTLSRQEQRFMNALQAVDRFAVSGDALILFQGRRPRARFVADRRR